MTNREMLKAIFPEAHIEVLSGDMGVLYMDWEWLDAEYVHEKPKTGKWLRMSDLSEEEDYRYKCSYCGNVLHYKNKMNLLAFNGWCGRCGSCNRGEVKRTYASLKQKVSAIQNDIPRETVTEFADRCRECGAKYGKLLQGSKKSEDKE